VTRDVGGFWDRLLLGTRWTWLDERFRPLLPADLDESVMTLDARDRLHTKQGRSTARVVFHGPAGPFPVYLKRHYRLSWSSRLAALFFPSGTHTPGSAELAHLERVRALGINVPDTVAAGERIGPWGRLQSFLMVAELTGSLPLNEALPPLHLRMPPPAFERLKRRLAKEMAEMAAALHRAYVFHKDLYLCHFFLYPDRIHREQQLLALIDLHRLGEHRICADRWRWKDLGQLLFSTRGVDGIGPRDALRFWVHYQRRARLRHARFHVRMIGAKSARYLRHNS
jgi:heptose I phosphotransferase